MIERSISDRVRDVAGHYPIVTITGPRQSGKTTLVRMLFADRPYVNLEAPDVREAVRSDPREFLSRHRGGAVIDEVQRVPELLSYLQVEVDERPEPGRFVLTGSVNMALLGAVSQSLSGRTALLTLLPLGLEEIRRFDEPCEDLIETMWRGSYPAVFDRGIPPTEWYASYVGTYVERDVRQILNVGNLTAFQAFLRLCAGRTAQLLNLSSLAADCGVTHNTARSWLSVLEASHIVSRLPPLTTNLTKRQVKTPKLHFLDTGLVCYLLGVTSPDQLAHHPLRGAVFETWVVSEIMKARASKGLQRGLHFTRDRKGNEVDLVIETGDRLLAVETKSGQTIASDFFRGLDLFEKRAGAASVTKVLVHGGDAAHDRHGTRLVPWNAMHEMSWS